MTDDSEPPESKLTRSKQRWAREGKFLTGKVTRPQEQRLPPGQHLTADWPVLDLGLMPNISRERWRLDVYGAVEQTIYWTWQQFMPRPLLASSSFHIASAQARATSSGDSVAFTFTSNSLCAGPLRRASWRQISVGRDTLGVNAREQN